MCRWVVNIKEFLMHRKINFFLLTFEFFGINTCLCKGKCMEARLGVQAVSLDLVRRQARLS